MSLDIYLYRPYTFDDDGESGADTVYSDNITINLSQMATEANLYDTLWGLRDMDIVRAETLIELLEKGLEMLESEPEHFKQFDPPNGWGEYDNFVPFISKYLAACKEWPLAFVEVS